MFACCSRPKPNKGKKNSDPEDAAKVASTNAAPNNAKPEPPLDKQREEAPQQTGPPPKAVPHPSSHKEELQGVRPSMEDTNVTFDLVTKDSFPNLPHELDQQMSFFGVYDGHGGIEAAKLCQTHLHENIFSYLLEQKEQNGVEEFDFPDALTKAFRQTDQQIIEASLNKQVEVEEGGEDGEDKPSKKEMYCKDKQFVFKCGTTVGVAILFQQKLWVANVGDTEIVLSKHNPTDGTYEPIVLTKKHMVSVPEERERIQKQGGIVIKGRLYGDLIVSRSLGDPQYKSPHCGLEGDLISCVPHIHSVPLHPIENDFLILACDGLWDVIKYKQAIDLIIQWRKENKPPSEISKLLAKEALNLRSQDNVTVVVVFFNWEIIK